jgi:hypothetical protein
LTRLKQYVSEEQYNEVLKKFQKENDKDSAKKIVSDLAESIPDQDVGKKYVELLN